MTSYGPLYGTSFAPAPSGWSSGRINPGGWSSGRIDVPEALPTPANCATAAPTAAPGLYCRVLCPPPVPTANAPAYAPDCANLERRANQAHVAIYRTLLLLQSIAYRRQQVGPGELEQALEVQLPRLEGYIEDMRAFVRRCEGGSVSFQDIGVMGTGLQEFEGPGKRVEGPGRVLRTLEFYRGAAEAGRRDSRRGGDGTENRAAGNHELLVSSKTHAVIPLAPPPPPPGHPPESPRSFAPPPRTYCHSCTSHTGTHPRPCAGHTPGSCTASRGPVGSPRTGRWLGSAGGESSYG